MAIVVKDRVKETAVSPGTGTITLAGAASGFQSFNAVGDGNITYFAIVDSASGDWEVNYGEYASAGTTLTRNATPLSSSNSGNLVNFTGTVDVFCTYPSEKAVYEEVNGDTIINGGPLTVWGSGISATPAGAFGSTVGQLFADLNNFSQLYNQNLNDGQYASSDFVAYNNNATTGEEFYVDMGINSGGFNDTTTYPIFPYNSAYLYSAGVDGGTVGQNADLYIGTGTSNSDVVLFAGGLDKPNIAGVLKSATQALVLKDGATALTTDTGEKLQVYGTAKITGATAFASPVTTSSSMTAPANNEFVTKSYVDNATSTGIHIHTPCAAETSAALSAAYTQGGTTFNITDITGTDTVVTSTTHGLSVNDQIWLTSAGNGLSINTPYFVYDTPTTTSLQLSETYGGTLLTGLTNASGLTYATRANSGVGAYLEASANEALPVADVIVGDRVLVYNQSTGYWNGVYTVTALGASGGGGSKWKLTRATDADYYSPANTNGLSEGDYFFIQSNSESYVLTTPGAIIIGYTGITYTLFSSVPSYVVDSPLQLVGNELSLTTVPATLGGTGYSSYTAGQLLYADTTTTFAKLGIGSQYQVLQSTGSAPQWGSLPLNQSAAVSGALGAANGGTGQSTYATGDTLYSSATNTLSKLSGNTSTTKKFLTQTGTGADSAAPVWDVVNGSDVNGNISGQAGSVANALTAGTYLVGSSFDGAVARTWTVDATSANTASKVVARDASGNFSAGTITAALSGNATTATTATNVAGGAANKLVYNSSSGTTAFADAPTVSGQVLSWNGSAFSWVAGTISGVALGSNLNALTFGTYLTAGGSSYNGSAGVTISTNATSANTASTLVARDASGNFSAGTITAALSGNASTATSATTATNLAGGAASQIPYQTGSGATSFIANGTSGQVLTSNGSSAPSWQTSTAASKSYVQAMSILRGL